MYTVYVTLKNRAYDQSFERWGEVLRYANQQIYNHSPSVEFVCIDRKDGTTVCTWNKDSKWTYHVETEKGR